MNANNVIELSDKISDQATRLHRLAREFNDADSILEQKGIVAYMQESYDATMVLLSDLQMDIIRMKTELGRL